MEDGLRLNKYIAQAGVCSRRKADELIAAGKVKVNGSVMDQLGYRVQPGDRVEAAGRVLGGGEKKVYYMLNKPVGYVTTLSDEFDRPTVMELMADVEERVFPVGRLDYGTSGLLLFTNDGELAYRLTHPSRQIDKVYRARLNEPLTEEKLKQLRRGVDIGGFVTSPAQVEVLKQNERGALVEIIIHEGKNRQVRKMFDAVGCRVLELERVALGGLTLGRLKPGHYRKLSREELAMLRGRES